MTDLFGRRLGTSVHKRFGVGAAAREPLATDAWTVVPPAPGSREAVVVFPTALDWAMLFNAIAVAPSAGEPVPGCIAVGEGEMRWSFTPGVPWAADAYQVQIDASLEDPCGNTPLAAFDRPIRAGVHLSYETGIHAIPFVVA